MEDRFKTFEEFVNENDLKLKPGSELDRELSDFYFENTARKFGWHPRTSFSYMSMPGRKNLKPEEVGKAAFEEVKDYMQQTHGVIIEESDFAKIDPKKNWYITEANGFWDCIIYYCSKGKVNILGGIYTVENSDIMTYVYGRHLTRMGQAMGLPEKPSTKDIAIALQIYSSYMGDDVKNIKPSMIKSVDIKKSRKTPDYEVYLKLAPNTPDKIIQDLEGPDYYGINVEY